MNMHSYHLPAVQRHYEWGEANVEKFVNDLFRLFDDQLPCQPLGNVTVYKDNPSSYEYLIVDGQQRLMTTIILLSVIRLFCMERRYDPSLLSQGSTNPDAPFYYRGARRRGERLTPLPRFVPKAGQQDFWNTYIISWGNTDAPNRLGEFWDNSGNLQLHLSGDNVYNKNIMVAAHTIKRALSMHTTQRNTDGPPRLMIDSEELLGFFTTEALSCTKLTFTALVGGSSADLCHLFISFNDVGLVLSDYDIIKANVLLGGNRGARVPDGERNWEVTWELHQNKLSSYQTCKRENLPEKAQQADNMFQKSFDVIHKVHVLKRASSMHVDLRRFFILDLDARTQPARFMDWFFTPVVQSMDAIFNWRGLWRNDNAASSTHGISEEQIRADKIYSILRSLTRLWTSTNEIATQIMSWLPVLVLLMAQWDRSREGHRDLLDMLAALDRRATLNFMVKGSHLKGRQLASRCRNISGQVMELLNSRGLQGTEIQQAQEGAGQRKKRRSTQTTKISSKVCGATERPSNEEWRKALDQLDVHSEAEQKQLLQTLVQLKYERSSYRTMYLLLLYDDALRSPRGPDDLNGPAPYQLLTDYDSLLHSNSSCWEREHIAPQKSPPEWMENWSPEARERWLDCPANLLLVSQRTNRGLKNASWSDKLQAYLGDEVVCLSTRLILRQSGLPAEQQGVAAFTWTPETCIRRFEDMIRKVAITRLGLNATWTEEAIQGEIARREQRAG